MISNWRISLLSAGIKSCVKSHISCLDSYNMVRSFPKVNDIHSFVPCYLLSTNYMRGTVLGAGDTIALFLPLTSFYSSGEPILDDCGKL